MTQPQNQVLLLTIFLFPEAIYCVFAEQKTSSATICIVYNKRKSRYEHERSYLLSKILFDWLITTYSNNQQLEIEEELSSFPAKKKADTFSRPLSFYIFVYFLYISEYLSVISVGSSKC